MPETHDFIVIGAGPGGSYAAKTLAEAGFDTLILEKEKLPRDKPCGGWVTPNVWKMLGWSDKRVRNHVLRGAVFYGPDLRRVVLEHSSGNRAIFRDEFDHAAAMDAVDAGALLRDAERARRISRAGDGITVQTDIGEYGARAVIGADGTACFTGRQLGLRGPYRPGENMFTYSKLVRLTGRQLQEFDLPYPEYSHIFITDYAVGYGWFCRRKEWVNIGIGHPAWLLRNKEERMRIWNRFAADLGKVFNRDGKHPLDLSRPRGYSYPAICGPRQPTSGDRVLLIGDAGGFASNSSGEGIGPAMVTGMMAANVLEHAYGKGDFSSQTLSVYERMWKSRMQASFDSVNAFLRGYIRWRRLRRWFNHNALDFLEIFMENPVLNGHLEILLAPESNKDEAFREIKRDIPEALLRFMIKKLRQ